jgi:hypothetical protein
MMGEIEGNGNGWLYPYPYLRMPSLHEAEPDGTPQSQAQGNINSQVCSKKLTILISCLKYIFNEWLVSSTGGKLYVHNNLRSTRKSSVSIKL